MPKVLNLLHTEDRGDEVVQHVRLLAQRLQPRFESCFVYPTKGAVIVERAEQARTSHPGSNVLWPFTPLRGELSESAVREIVESFQPQLIHIQHFANWPISIIRQLVDTQIPVVTTLYDLCAITPQLEFFADQGDDLLSSAQCEAIFDIDISSHLKTRFKSIQTALQAVRMRITASQFVADQLGRYGLEDCRLIPHCLVSDELTDAERERLKVAYEERDLNGPVRFGFIGGLGEYGGWTSVRDAVSSLQAEGVACELMRFATGDDKTELPGVITIPFEPHNWKIQLQCIDVGIVAPRIVPFSALTVEYFLASRKPVVASRIGVLPEWVQDGVNGRIVALGKTAELIQTLRDIATNPEWRQWQCSPHTTVSTMAAAIAAVYEELLSGSSH